MEIKASCRLDLESMRALVHLRAYRGKSPKKRLTASLIMLPLLYALIIFEMIAFGINTLLVVLLVVTVALTFLTVYNHFLMPKASYKRLGVMQGSINSYTFRDEDIVVSTVSSEYNGEAIVSYSVIVSAFETSRYFFLTQTNSTCFVVDKSTVLGGTAEQLRQKLQSAVPKYVLCKY
ncbi:MAG: YcxB family protein [Clostridia bacterium]|nr:YcxB family protein [Clostridia bacterium]